MAISVAQIFDTKLRGARKSARTRVKEAKKLLRRAGGAVSTDVQNEIVTGVGAAARDQGVTPRTKFIQPQLRAT